MTIKDTFKQLFKCPNKRNTESFKNIIGKDFLNTNLSVDKFKKKCTKISENLIKNISSLSEKQAKEKYEVARNDLKMLKENTPKLVSVIKDFDIKYQFLYRSIEEYRDELKKKIDNIPE